LRQWGFVGLRAADRRCDHDHRADECGLDDQPDDAGPGCVPVDRTADDQRGSEQGPIQRVNAGFLKR
jgi:hypothetical protein